MQLFETTLILLLIAIVLLQSARHLRVPYPTMLALAGACIAALPFAPAFVIEPHLALALFVAPALLDAAYDTSPRELRRNWVPLVALVLVAVGLTTAAVAWVGWTFGGLPLAAAITLGAIVAPPDAAAASALLNQLSLPRRTVTILQGESLLNDAVALLIFGAAVHAAKSPSGSISHAVPMLLIAVPAGIAFGWVLARAYLAFRRMVAGTLSAALTEFVFTFGAWLVAERLRLSPIISVVAFAMTVATHVPASENARERVHSYSVWDAVVFVLNVLAFLLMGLQARTILARLHGDELWRAGTFSLLVLVLVIGVRVAWVMAYGATVRRLRPVGAAIPSRRLALVVSWCGMRGLVTLATAMALPARFPERDLIVLSAFSVVLGTLVIQGLTIRPLLLLLRIEPDRSLGEELSFARSTMLEAAIQSLSADPSAAAEQVREEYAAARTLAQNSRRPQAETEHDQLRMKAIRAEREVLAQLRRQGSIDDDAFHRLEEELDWAELAASPPERISLQSS